MANILRTIVLRSNFGGLNRGGIFQTSLGSQKLFPVSPNLVLNSLIKCSSVNSPERQSSNFKDYKSSVYPEHRRISKFEQVHFFKYLNNSELTEGVILNTFQKIFKICEKFKHWRGFKNEVNQFIHSKDFVSFCEALNKKLPTLSLGSLITLIDLEIFLEAKVVSSLVPKILDLILDNFNKLTLLEVVYLYTKFSQSKFNDRVHWRNIKKACEVYFKERFELDLLNYNYSEELLTVIKLEVLPESVRKSVARKLLNDAYLNACNQKVTALLIRTICETNHTFVPKDELMRIIKKASYTFFSHSLITSLSHSYATLLLNDDSFFDDEIITLLISTGFTKLNSPYVQVKFIHNMSLVGYYKKEFVSFVCTFLETRSARSVNAELAMRIASILAQYSFHETEPEEDVRIVRKLLLPLNSVLVDDDGKRLSFFEICTWCEYLTYLGCDTTNLCNELFTTVMESPVPIPEKNILTLHHLAKAQHSSRGQTLPKELLRVLLADEFQKFQSFSVDSLTPYFSSEDYVLKNCTTSDNHCLHFVSLFGADNKPINLSDYKKKQSNLPLSEFLNIEDIQRPPGSKMVVFQIFPDKRPIKFINEPRLTGIAKMYLKPFENLDCSVVLLPNKFFTLPPEAREEFLRAKVNEVIENSESPQSTVVEQ